MSIRRRFGATLHQWAHWLAPDYLYQHSILPSLPWAFVQTVVERELARLLPSLAHQRDWNMIDVGAYTGEELPRIKRANPGKTINAWLYEANPRIADECQRNFADDPTVSVVPKAVGSTAGRATFYETTVVGNGSLLPLARSTITPSQPIENAHSFPVDVVALDDCHPTLSPDLLWIDVQGAETSVLQGASQLLARTKSVFIEVQHGRQMYSGSCSFDEVDHMLRAADFSPYLLGIDPATGQGNAFYIASSLLPK